MRRKIRSEDDNIVKVTQTRLPSEAMPKSVHHFSNVGGGITEAKRHHVKLIKSIRGNK